MITFEANLLCSKIPGGCNGSCIAGEVSENPMEAQRLSIAEAQGKGWLVEVAPDSSITGLCPKCKEARKPAKAEQPPQPFRLEAGKRYRTRGGRETDGVIEIHGCEEFRFHGRINGSFRAWKDNGRYFPSETESPLDLISEIK